MTKYRCWFEIANPKVVRADAGYEEESSILLLSADTHGGPATFSQGFWLDDALEYKPGLMDVRYWIPPHCILYIEKVPQ